MNRRVITDITDITEILLAQADRADAEAQEEVDRYQRKYPHREDAYAAGAYSRGMAAGYRLAVKVIHSRVGKPGASEVPK